jgi:hypothetical protein
MIHPIALFRPHHSCSFSVYFISHAHNFVGVTFHIIRSLKISPLIACLPIVLNILLLLSFVCYHHGELRPLVGESQAKKGTKKERARFTDVVGITSIDGGHFW